MPAPVTLSHPPFRGTATPAFAVVVPQAIAIARTKSMLTLVGWLADELEHPPTVVCWQSGPLVGAFEALTPVIDAGAVNRHPAARALATVGLTPVSRRLKSVQLRRVLTPLAGCDRLLFTGADALALLEWLPRRPARRVAVWLDDDDVQRLGRVTAAATSFLVSGALVAEALEEQGVAREQLHRVAEPLIEPPGPVAETDDARRVVGVVGAGPDTGEALPGILAVLAATLDTPPPTVAWVHDDLRRSWARWTDPRFAGLEDRLVDWSVDECRRRLGELSALVSLGPHTGTVTTEAGLRGVPLLALGGTGGAVAECQDDLAALTEQLRSLLTDATLWREASAESARLADPHRVDRVGRTVLRALDLPDR